MWGVYAPPHKVGQTSSAQKQQKPHEPHEPHVTCHACPNIENWRGFGSMSLERRHLHKFCKVFQIVEERFMLCEVPVNSGQKKLCQRFLQKQPTFWPLMDQNFSKTLVCVSFCFRKYEIPSILHPIQSNNIVVLFRFGSNCIISKCKNFKDIRHKVRKVQHQYPEFGHKEGEIIENLHKNTLTFKGRGEFFEFHPTFFFS